MKYVMTALSAAALLCLCGCSAGTPSAAASSKTPSPEGAAAWTLEDIRYYAGGDSNGSTDTLSLSRRENVLVLNQSPAFYVPVRVSEYSVTADTFTKIEALLDPAELGAWSKIEAETEVLDGPGNSYMFRITENGAENTYYIDGYADLGGGNAVLKEVMDIVRANMNEQQLRVQYLLNEEEAVADAEISSLNEETITYLMGGYWQCVSELVDGQPEDHGITLMNSNEYCSYTDAEHEESEEFTIRIVKEPLEDLDSAWYAVFENDEHSFTAVLRGAKLITSRQAGEHMRYCVFERAS
ncbi:MAG: hypothetical protein K6G61_02560 [Solobacterium sp.]|nr:hypothetical protein [Solobacterium sp.]